MASTINASTSPAAIVQTADGTGILSLQTGNTTAVTIDASQNVGIGTTSPVTSYRLSIYDQTNGATNISGLALIEPGGATSYSYFKATSQASADTRTIIGNGAVSRAFAFETGGTERMRIDSSGNLIVGNSATPDSTHNGRMISGGSSGYFQSSAGNTSATYYHFYFTNSNGDVGKISTNGTATTYATSSDYRLKDNPIPMTGALEKVAQLKPVTYKWKYDNSSGQGFIAHELQEVVPECVVGEKDAVDTEGNPEYQGIDTSFLVATLTAAIQEQQALITSLTARITALEGA